MYKKWRSKLLKILDKKSQYEIKAKSFQNKSAHSDNFTSENTSIDPFARVLSKL